MKHLFGFLAILISMTILFLVGCQKDESSKTAAPAPGDINSSEKSIIIGDGTFEGLNGFADDYFTSSGLKSLPLTCPSISLSQLSTFPISVTLDWGTGCSSADDGTTRSGKIIISLSGLMSQVNSVATFTFKDFVSDGYKISGTHKITYLGLNSGNNWPRYSVFTEAKIVFPDSKFITYRAEYTRLKSEGASTATLDDDVWRIEGHSSGVTREGVAWTASYPSALVKKHSCKWFSSGSVKISSEGKPDKIVNFGDGTCDNNATLTIEDKTYNITL